MCISFRKRNHRCAAASKQTKVWEIEGIVQWAGRKGIEGIWFPQEGSILMGKGERIIWIPKKQIQRSLEGKRLRLKKLALFCKQHPR
jgi:hypothetical protein